MIMFLRSMDCIGKVLLQLKQSKTPKLNPNKVIDKQNGKCNPEFMNMKPNFQRIIIIIS